MARRRSWGSGPRCWMDGNDATGTKEEIALGLLKVEEEAGGSVRWVRELESKAKRWSRSLDAIRMTWCTEEAIACTWSSCNTLKGNRYSDSTRMHTLYWISFKRGSNLPSISACVERTSFAMLYPDGPRNAFGNSFSQGSWSSGSWDVALCFPFDCADGVRGRLRCVEDASTLSLWDT